MPIGKLYRTWKEQIRRMRPGQRITQVENFAWMMVGIYQGRSVHLSKIAGKILGQAKLFSTVRRLERFLDNKAIEVREGYQPIAKRWIEEQWKQLGEIRLIVAGTKIGLGHQLRMVSLAYRRRSIPMAWDWERDWGGVRGGTYPPALPKWEGGVSAYESVNFQKQCFVSRGLSSSPLGEAGVG